jgi:AcrR family transcriptional regulator
VPRLWNETIEAHRNAVREATLKTTAALAAEHGLGAVTMSRIAKETGIGRATLYKYFPDVESILIAWHDRQVGGHLELLAAVRDRAGTSAERLADVLRTYAVTTHERPHDTEFAALVHRGGHMAEAERHLRELVEGLLVDAARDGAVRDDVPPVELAGFCLHALGAAGGLPSRDAVERLVTVTLDAVRPAG